MAKHCETFDHTADVGLDAQADTLEELFEALAEGVADLICPRARVGRVQERTVRLSAGDVEGLAADFLNEVVATIQTEHFAVAGVRVRRIDESGIEAELAGEPYDRARHEFGMEVKAVTYHQLRIVHEGGRWIGRVILDV